MVIEGPGEDRFANAPSCEIEVEASKAARPRVPGYVYYALLLLVIIFFAALRVRLRDIPLERDEGEYAYAGQLMLQGIPPYQLVYTMKLPGTFAAYAVMMALFGQTPAGLHTGLIFVNAFTTFLVFLLGKRLYGRLAGVVAGASYALFSTSAFLLGFAGHATHFVVLFAVAGILLLLQALESDRIWLFFTSGLLLGLAFLMKQPGLAFLFFAGLYVIQQKWKPPINWKSMTASVGALALGSLLPFAVVCLVIWRDGLFPKFWFWVFIYARGYGSTQSPWGAFASIFGEKHITMLERIPSLVLFIALVIATFLFSARARSHTFFAVSLFVFSFLAICPGFYFRNHYFILMLPVVSLLVGMIVSVATEKLLLWRGSVAVAGLPVLLFLIASSILLFHQREFLFQMTPLEACRDRYAENPFPEALEIAGYVKSHSPQGATIAVLGSEPEIYFYSHRHSATGYIYVYPLLEPQKYALMMQQEMMAEIEAARPDVLIYVNVPDSWVYTRNPLSAQNLIRWMQGYLQEHYAMVGVAEIGEVTEYHWGEQAKDVLQRSKDYVWIFKRKTS